METWAYGLSVRPSISASISPSTSTVGMYLQPIGMGRAVGPKKNCASRKARPQLPSLVAVAAVEALEGLLLVAKAVLGETGALGLRVRRLP